MLEGQHGSRRPARLKVKYKTKFWGQIDFIVKNRETFFCTFLIQGVRQWWLMKISSGGIFVSGRQKSLSPPWILNYFNFRSRERI